VRTGELKHQVIGLLSRVSRAPEQPFPGGAGHGELQDLARRMGTGLPGELVEWLRVCRGEAIGPGGVYGARPDCDRLDMATVLASYPSWRDSGWLPVAGDGCGDHYVLLTTGPLAGCVGFVEAVTDPDRIRYLVASDLWHFLFFLFSADLGERSWPFDAPAVLVEDPGLARTPAALLPWL
jgi:cell wall assembly regulator SMI1